MSKYRYGYYASNNGDSPKGVSFNTVTSYDYDTGYKDSFTLSELDAVGEPIFVPKNQDSRILIFWNEYRFTYSIKLR